MPLQSKLDLDEVKIETVEEPAKTREHDVDELQTDHSSNKEKSRKSSRLGRFLPWKRRPDQIPAMPVAQISEVDSFSISQDAQSEMQIMESTEANEGTKTNEQFLSTEIDLAKYLPEDSPEWVLAMMYTVWSLARNRENLFDSENVDSHDSSYKLETDSPLAISLETLIQARALGIGLVCPVEFDHVDRQIVPDTIDLMQVYILEMKKAVDTLDVIIDLASKVSEIDFLQRIQAAVCGAKDLVVLTMRKHIFEYVIDFMKFVERIRTNVSDVSMSEQRFEAWEALELLSWIDQYKKALEYLGKRQTLSFFT